MVQIHHYICVVCQLYFNKAVKKIQEWESCGTKELGVSNPSFALKESANIINQDNIKIRLSLSFMGGDQWVKFDKQIEVQIYFVKSNY